MEAFAERGANIAKIELGDSETAARATGRREEFVRRGLVTLTPPYFSASAQLKLASCRNILLEYMRPQ